MTERPDGAKFGLVYAGNKCITWKLVHVADSVGGLILIYQGVFADEGSNGSFEERHLGAAFKTRGGVFGGLQTGNCFGSGDGARGDGLFWGSVTHPTHNYDRHATSIYMVQVLYNLDLRKDALPAAGRRRVRNCEIDKINGVIATHSFV